MSVLDFIAMRHRCARYLAVLTAAFFCAPVAKAQQESPTKQWSLTKTVVDLDKTHPNQSVRMVINQSREIAADIAFKRVTIQNPSVISAIPLEGGNRLQLSALATGITSVDLVSADDTVHSIEVLVVGDVRELETLIQQIYPGDNISIMPVQNGCFISGFVTSAEHVENVITIAEQYFPTVINDIKVAGVHTIQLEVQIMEVSRTKLRELGIDWALQTSGGTTVSQGVGGFLEPAIGLGVPGGALTGTIAEASQNTFNLGIIESSASFFSSIRALRRNNLVKVLATPTLTAVDGRPASFNAGGELPILVPAGLGQVAVQFREFGTRLDYVAQVQENGKIWLEVRPYVSEIDPTRSVILDGINVPGLRSRFLETGVTLGAGQTLALGGLLQVRTEAINTGVPILAEMPWVGSMFRTTREEQNEIELLITVTPNFAGPMNPNEVPAVAPGTSTQSPTDKDLYLRGYIETPITGSGGVSAASCTTPGLIESGYGAPVGAHMMNGVPANGVPVMGGAVPAGQSISTPMQPAAPAPNPAAMSVGPNAPRLAQPAGYSADAAPVIR
ncbi:MAG: pilus assembly protein N-terminal domain-containing protein [Planctomycetota bacterium]